MLGAEKKHLVVGQVVESVRFGRAVVVKIHGRQVIGGDSSLDNIAPMTSSSVSFDIVYYSGARAIMVPEIIICGGLPWKILDIVVGLDEVTRLSGIADELEREEAEKKSQAAAEFAIEKCRLQGCPEYQHLQKMQGVKLTEAALVSKNIRYDLKKKFPKTKFSVKKYGYDSVGITWNDGPTKEEVEEVTGKYKSGSFNGMEDIYEYRCKPFNDIFGGVKFIDLNREFSDALILRAICLARGRFGSELVPEICSVEMYRKGGFHNIGRDVFCYGLNREVNLILSEMKE